MAVKIKWQDKDMEIRRQNDEEMKKYGVELTRRSNPIKQVQDNHVNLFLCDQHVDESGDLTAQSCVDIDTLAVTRHG